MLKETLAVFLVAAGVAIALADNRADEPVTLSAGHDARGLPLEVSADLRLDAALTRLTMEYGSPAAKVDSAITELAIRNRTAAPRKRVVNHECPHSIPAPDVARKLSSEPGGSSSKLAG